MFMRSPRPGAPRWKTGLLLQQPSSIFTIHFSWQFSRKWILSSAYKLCCLSFTCFMPLLVTGQLVLSCSICKSKNVRESYWIPSLSTGNNTYNSHSNNAFSPALLAMTIVLLTSLRLFNSFLFSPLSLLRYLHCHQIFKTVIPVCDFGHSFVTVKGCTRRTSSNVATSHHGMFLKFGKLQQW